MREHSTYTSKHDTLSRPNLKHSFVGTRINFTVEQKRKHEGKE